MNESLWAGMQLVLLLVAILSFCRLMQLKEKEITELRAEISSLKREQEFVGIIQPLRRLN